jgi:UDP-N-acetylglucosamine--N-acetylmuramyl-(pentapeptide) pyrophosphoryl-undecaprenol N-acetylglucosamine transferase
MRMIVAGGGTGGHLFPGLAVAEALTAHADASVGDAGVRDADVLFVGSAFGIEATVIPRTRFRFQPVAIRGLRGRGARGVLEFVWQLPLALLQSWRVIARFRPAIVLGLGGYGSVPTVVAAGLRRVPIVLMEQNAHPGMANRVLAHLARRVCTMFADSAGFFPSGKVVHTGNPVRQLRVSKRPAPTHFTLFVFGGSQGARAINRAVVDAATVLRARLPRMQLIHQTGPADLEWVQRQYTEHGVEAEVCAFVQDMGEAYGRADLVVCRAGASTLAELTALGKPSILVPYPFAADDHQRTNAEILVRYGAAEMILDAQLTGTVLAERVLALAADRARLQAIGAAARALAVPDAAQRVVAVCRQVVVEEG